MIQCDEYRLTSADLPLLPPALRFSILLSTSKGGGGGGGGIGFAFSKDQAQMINKTMRQFGLSA